MPYVSISQATVSFDAICTLLKRELGVKNPFQMHTTKDEGYVRLIGGRGLNVDVLPADQDSFQASIILSDTRVRFPLLHNAFLLEDHSGTRLLVEETLGGFIVTGTVSESVAHNLGLAQQQRLVA